jgi:uncharacterized protein YdeI (YjbR/CyaY-like superfamily)
MNQTFTATSRAEWRSWLQTHHTDRDEIWLVYFKKHTGKAGLGYRESVEEALCFGWIDGLKRRIDEERYTHRFTPRRPGSRWSALNIRLAEELIAQGKMSAAGLAAFEQRQTSDESRSAADRTRPLSLPADIEEKLRSNRLAWKNFQALAPGYRRQYMLWLSTAVKPETRHKRLTETIRLLEQNRKLGMK